MLQFNKDTQQLKESKDRCSKNKVRREPTKELDNLFKIVKPNRATKRQLLNLCSKLEDLATELSRKKNYRHEHFLGIPGQDRINFLF